MVKLTQISAFLEKLYPFEYAEDFDNVGLLAGRFEKDVQKVIVCLDCDKNVVNEAIKEKAQLIITHHPVIFNPVKRIVDNTDEGEMLVNAMENGISIYSAHTNFDSAPNGITDTVAKKLGLCVISNMEGVLGRICSAPDGTDAKSLCKKIKEEFNIKTLYSTFTENRKIHTVAICNGGGGGSMVSVAQQLNADVYISGDLKHHEILSLKINDNIDFIEMRHYDSEVIVCDILKEKLEAELGENITVVKASSQASPLVDTDNIV